MITKRTAVVVATILALVSAMACGSSEDASQTSASSGGPSSPTPPSAEGGSTGGGGQVCSTATQTCDPATEVTTSDDVVSKILATKQQNAPTYTVGRDLATAGSTGADLAPTVDLRATAELDLDIDALGSDVFAFNMTTSGVSCVETADGGDGCLRIHIAQGTIVRFARVLDSGGMFPKANPRRVEVLDPCATPCAGNQAWCGNARLCIAVKEFCARCDGKSPAVCACQMSCVASREGVSCEYNTSQDTFEDGVCTGGECK